MKTTLRISLLIILLSLLVSCQQNPAQPTVTDEPAVTDAPEVTAVPATTAEHTVTSEAGTADQKLVQITILYTNDEHGWMEGMEAGQGAAELVGLWRREDGYDEDGNFLVISGGDNWTGAAISTWFDGQSMVEVMNSMGYDSATIGNHEFDFGLEGLQERLEEAQFPYLSANLRSKESGELPQELGIQAYTLVEVGGVQVGIIGLTSTSTPYTTNPVNVSSFEFIDYEQALREIVPQVRAAGAQMVLVPAHACVGEMLAVAEQVQDLQIDLFGSGHCNEFFAEEAGGSLVISGGYHMSGYAYATFAFNPGSGEAEPVEYGVRDNENAPADESVASVVEKWREASQAELNLTIGYLEDEIGQRSDEMQALITESWLWAYGNADAALTNLGGMRASIPAGDLTMGEIYGVMPFNNVLVEVQLTGQEVLKMIGWGGDRLAIGGLRRQSINWIVEKTGELLDRQATYSVLVNDFMYAGGDNYTMLAEYDPQGYNTGIDWRQPVVDWILAQDSSAQVPLDKAIAALEE